MVERSTVGAAGLRRKTTTTKTANTTAATPVHNAIRRIFFCFRSGRAISIDLGYSTCRAKPPMSLQIETKGVVAPRNAARVYRSDRSRKKVSDFEQ
jgi:hypothetical protein